MKVGVGKSIVELLAIIIDKSHFDLLFNVNKIKKVGANSNLKKNLVIINRQQIDLKKHLNLGAHLVKQEYGVYNKENIMLELGVLQEIHVNYQNFQEDQNYIFNPIKQKQLRGNFATAVGAEH